MNLWIYGSLGIGIVLLMVSLVFFINDSKKMTFEKRTGVYLLPNLSLTIISLLWIGLAGFLYFDVQSQINYFLK